jgi:hypothetical protein
MAANLPRPSVTENVSTALSSGISDSIQTMTVDDATGIVEPCYLVIDRVDTAGVLKPSSFWEYVKVTGKSGSDLTITRGVNGSTAQAHGSGAVVEAVVTSAMFEDWYTALNAEHTAAGGHVISTASITSVMASTLIVSAVTVTTSLNVSSASVQGLGLNPTWYIPSLPSLASTGLGRPMTMPRAGTFGFVNITLNANISCPSVFFDINKNFVSIFDAGTRPLIAGGTFVSTASIAIKTFNQGDVMSIDLDFGGNNVDGTVTLAGL